MVDAIDEQVSLVLIGEATHGTHEFYRIGRMSHAG